MRFQGILRVLQDPPLSGYENMARNEALFLVGEVPTLRFFSWNTPTLSLGRYQRTEDLDVPFLQEEKIPVVRRPTGGRAILHGDEVTFSFFLPIPCPHRVLYSIVQGVLEKAFADVGVFVDACVSKAPSPRSPACFSLALPHELAVSGKKVAGIAQARSSRGNLFEGSIPFSLYRSLFASCFREKERVFRELCEGALGLLEVQGNLEKHDLIAAMTARFGELFDGMVFGVWTEEELATTQKLLLEKYAPSSSYHYER
ncbi:lipoate--protein ligase family protein [Candidatus Caldatribacterium sp. SIUC1]|uniref:lipoate--protein ligase family protein n=1 Tax=Candidatus Caldatribacterium sp. SIUC1 TaxID=3418365 RepID=UPI003F68D9A4